MDVETEQQVVQENQENGEQLVSREVETIKAEEVSTTNENKDEGNSAEAGKPAPEDDSENKEELEQDQKTEENPAEEPKKEEQEQQEEPQQDEEKQEESQQDKEQPSEEPKEEEEEQKNEEVQAQEAEVEKTEAEDGSSGDHKYDKVIAEAMALYEELFDTDKWNLDSDKDGVKGYSRLDEGTGLRMARGDGIINHPVDKISDAIMDHAKLMKWEGNLVREETVEQVDDFHVILSLDKKRPFVAQRETLMLNKVKKNEDGSFLMVGKSLVHEDFPEKKEYVRAQVYFSSWTLTPDKEDPSKTHGIYMIFVDPKGWVPKPVFNAFVSDQASNVKKLRNFLKGK